jgi:hypothetical protein
VDGDERRRRLFGLASTMYCFADLGARDVPHADDGAAVLARARMICSYCRIGEWR